MFTLGSKLTKANTRIKDKTTEKKVMKIKKTLIVISLISLISGISRSQVTNSTAAAVQVQEYDPISAMLDSLTTLNHVVRFNTVNAIDKEVCTAITCPSFSDEVYRERISKINTPIPLAYNKYVKDFIDLYALRKRALTARVMGLSNLYFPLYEEILDQEGLPLEFKYLSIVESALNPIAVSRCGATGLWQFMYNTGLLYNLKVNSYTDERRDPVKATHAACQYFKDMYGIYHDWLLVVAAYNCGAGNVNRAINRSGGKRTFWEIMPYLPQETRGYVPAFIAVNYVMSYAKEHNLYPIAPEYSYFQVDTVQVNRQVNFSVLSKQLDMPMDVIAYLNPVYKRNIIPDVDEGLTLRLPTNKMAQFISIEENVYAESKPLSYPGLPQFAVANNVNDGDIFTASNGRKYEIVSKKIKKSHTVKRGETLSEIADVYSSSVNDIKKLNRLKSTKVHRGQKLSVYAWVKTKVPVKETKNIATKKDSNAVKNNTASVTKKDSDSVKSNSVTATILDSSQQLIASLNEETADGMNADSQQTTVGETKNKAKTVAEKYIYHMVQHGDTLWNIAKRYEGVTVEQIKDINKLHDTNLKPGTRLKVMIAG